MRLVIRLLFLCKLVWSVEGACAQEVVEVDSSISEEQIESRLRVIRDRVHRSQELLRSLERQQFQLERDLRATDGFIKELGVKQGEIELAMEANQNRQKDLEREKQDIQQERDELFILFRQRVHALYLKSRGLYGVAPSLFQQTRGIDQQAILYGKIVARHDNNVLKTLAQLNTRLQEAQTALSEEDRHSRSLLYQYERLAASLTERQSQRKDIADQVKTQEERVKVVIKSLQAEALRLEHFVNSLTASTQSEREETSRAKLTISGVYQGEFEGPGLQKPITLPVEGSVKRRFGKEEIAEFAGYVMRKGVVFGAKEDGEEVRSIAAGVIRFVGELPGFDNVIIVDHGKRDYSLYGNLRQTEVAPGAFVSQGQVLASIDPKERELYFEVRHNGVPHDPEKFFEQGLAVQK